MDTVKVMIDNVGRWHLLSDDPLHDRPLCGYLGDVTIEERADTGYLCAECEQRRGPGPGPTVVGPAT